MKKKMKSPKTKNIAEKYSQPPNCRFNVNPLTKQELLQLIKDSKLSSPSKNEILKLKGEQCLSEWENFEVPRQFTEAVSQLANLLQVYDTMMYAFG